MRGDPCARDSSPTALLICQPCSGNENKFGHPRQPQKWSLAGSSALDQEHARWLGSGSLQQGIPCLCSQRPSLRCRRNSIRPCKTTRGITESAVRARRAGVSHRCNLAGCPPVPQFRWPDIKTPIHRPILFSVFCPECRYSSRCRGHHQSPG